MDKIVLGRNVAAELQDGAQGMIPAKVDTGAYLCAIWATDIVEQPDGTLNFVLFGPGSPHYTGEVLSTRNHYKMVVASSFGDKQTRYVVQLRMKLPNHHPVYVRTKFSLCDRSMKMCPILIGRKFLKNRFVVDVSVTDRTPLMRGETWREETGDEE